MVEKAQGAFRTIGEVSSDLGVPQHILRYWETRFPQLRPLQRAGNRRYYRPDDVTLARRISRLINEEGYTVRGVQQLLDAEPVVIQATAAETPASPVSGVDRDALRSIRALLVGALVEDAAPAR